MVQTRSLYALAALPLLQTYALTLDINSIQSIQTTASQIAHNLVSFYSGNQTGEIPGVLPQPYYWWESGAFFSTLIQYWNLTSDTQYNTITTQALLWQRGEYNDYMPANWSAQTANDDQSTRGLAALSAAGTNLPEEDGISWVELAEAVAQTQNRRWDEKTCGGGLRWQIFPYLAGYSYKNSASNGQFFELIAKLAYVTGNKTYVEWANRAWEWSRKVGFVDENWNIYDGAQATGNCSAINHVQYSKDAGVFVAGAAFMYNVTGEEEWKESLDGLVNRTLEVFFPGGVVTEVACEPSNRCNTDMKAFKGLLGQSLVDTMLVAPYTSGSITPMLRSSAEAAAKACSADGCSLYWDGTATGSDGESGVGESLSALTYVQALLVGKGVGGGGIASGTGSGSGSNGTATSGGASASGTQTGLATSGTGSATPTGNAGIVVGAEKAALGMLMTAWGLMSWLML